MPPAGETPERIPRGMIIAFVILFLVIIVAGVLYYQSQEQQTRDRVTGDLSSIALLKADQIASWREERLSDARVISGNPILVRSVREYLNSPDPARRAELLSFFEKLNESYQYRNVRLVDRDGRIVLNLNPNSTTVNPNLVKPLAEADARGDAVLTDLIPASDGKSPRMYLICPISASDNAGSGTVGAIVVTIDPHDYLYSLIESWPLPRTSAETLLVERQGDHVLFLNDLRFRNNTALNLTIPLSQTNVPAVMAVLGTPGSFEGTDYRGVDVVSVLEPIHGSPWFIVAKQDSDEAFAPWRTRALIIIVLVAVTLIGVSLITGLIWQRRQKYYYRSLAESESTRRLQEEQYRAIIETMQDAYFHADALGIITMANPAAVKMYGYGSINEMIGIPATALYQSSDDRADMLRHLDAEGRVYDYPGQGKRRDGSLFWVSINVRVIFDTDGRVTASEGFVRDITDRKQVEEALKKSEAFLNEVGRIAKVGGWEFDTDTLEQVWTEETYRIHELGPDFRPTVSSGIAFYLPSSRPAIEKAVRDAVEYGKPFDVELEFLTAKGNQRWVKITGRALVVDGRARKVFGTLQDVTDRKNEEETLRESEGRLHRFYDADLFGVIFWNMDGKITDANPRFLAMTGYTRDDLVEGRIDWPAMTPPEFRLRDEKSVEELLAFGKNRVPFEKEYFRKDGSRLPILIAGAMLDERRHDGVAFVLDMSDLKAATAALGESERKYRNLYQFALVGLFETSFKDATIAACNQRYAELAGFASVEDALGKDILHLYVNPEDREEVGRVLREKGFIENQTLKLQNQSTGRIFWVQFSARFNYEREVAEGSIIDITAQKEAEAEIQNSRNFLDSIIEQSPNPLWISDENGTLLRLNTACCNLLHVTPEEVVGKYNIFEDSIVETQGMMPLVRSVFEEGKSINFDLEYDTKLLRSPALRQSAKVYLNVTIFPIRDVSGRITNAVIQHMDFTERKMAEEALRESQTRLGMALGVGNTGVWQWNVEANEVFFDDRFHEMLGYPPGELPHTLEEWLPYHNQDDVLVWMAKAEAYLRGETSMYESEHRIRAKDGSWAWVFTRGQFVNSPTLGPKKLFVGIAMNVTDRKLNEVQREDLIRVLEQKNAELERFTYTVSHDLKSPLITIRGFAGLIEDDAQKGDTVQLKMDVQRITAAADTMQELLADVLELSRVGRVISPPEKTSFGTIVHEAVDLLAGPLAERGVRIDIAPDLPFVNVDHARMREVMVNLIENAVKFMGDQEHPAIRIGVETGGAEPVFFVRDNGIGIDPRYLERIFNLFERLDSATHGTGIGLTIVRRIIEVHGGKIRAESEGPGKGTMFKFTLPGVPSGKTDDAV
jgi:PAS domain S-box-containing protein